MLPPYDTRTALKRCGCGRALCAKTIMSLGDAFHDRDGRASGCRRTRDAVRPVAERGLIWITGNHDPAPPSWLGGEIVEEYRLAGLVFRHEPGVSSSRARLQAICIRVRR